MYGIGGESKRTDAEVKNGFSIMDSSLSVYPTVLVNNMLKYFNNFMN